jgi:hypothetical protein
MILQQFRETLAKLEIGNARAKWKGMLQSE